MRNRKATLMTVSALALAIALNSTALRSDEDMRAAASGSALDKAISEKSAAVASASESANPDADTK